MRNNFRLVLFGLLLVFFLGPMCLFNPLLFVGGIIFAIYFVRKIKEYKGTSYYQITKLPYLSMRLDAGRYGEYLTYNRLKSFEESGARFLFNVYVPKKNGETTEIDVLMICPKGVFVFESKNFSGWIFGDERQKNWCQTLPVGRRRSHKEYFYNPIWQNRGHISHLKALIGSKFPFYSVVVFSDRCSLRDIHIESKDVSVINRYDIGYTVSSLYCANSFSSLSSDEIERIYQSLYPHSQVSVSTKKKHIDDVYAQKSKR